MSNIKFPRVEFFDVRTGGISRDWRMFLLELFNRTGAEEGPAPVTAQTDVELFLSGITAPDMNAALRAVMKLAEFEAGQRQNTAPRNTTGPTALEAGQRQLNSDAVSRETRHLEEFGFGHRESNPDDLTRIVARAAEFGAGQRDQDTDSVRSRLRLLEMAIAASVKVSRADELEKRVRELESVLATIPRLTARIDALNREIDTTRQLYFGN